MKPITKYLVNRHITKNDIAEDILKPWDPSRKLEEFDCVTISWGKISASAVIKDAKYDFTLICINGSNDVETNTFIGLTGNHIEPATPEVIELLKEIYIYANKHNLLDKYHSIGKIINGKFVPE